jgi:DNA-binding CsgD family transcriptional regulator
VHFRDDPIAAVRALEAMQSAAPRLEHPLVENDLLRRRRATIVNDAQTHPRVHRATAQIMGWHSYLAAPLVVGGELIGAIHADTGGNRRNLDVLDGDILWTFARGLADAYETASLRRSLRRQRRDMRKFVEWLTARAIELSDSAIELVPERAPPPDPPGKLDAAFRGLEADDRVVFEGLLTRRELDVLRLLSRGHTNSAIAAHLVISEATVKFHIVNLLRKLHVSNRAAAVGRYHSLVKLSGDQN